MITCSSNTVARIPRNLVGEGDNITFTAWRIATSTACVRQPLGLNDVEGIVLLVSLPTWCLLAISRREDHRQIRGACMNVTLAVVYKMHATNSCWLIRHPDRPVNTVQEKRRSILELHLGLNLQQCFLSQYTVCRIVNLPLVRPFLHNSSPSWFFFKKVLRYVQGSVIYQRTEPSVVPNSWLTSCRLTGLRWKVRNCTVAQAVCATHSFIGFIPLVSVCSPTV